MKTGRRLLRSINTDLWEQTVLQQFGNTKNTKLRVDLHATTKAIYQLGGWVPRGVVPPLALSSVVHCVSQATQLNPCSRGGRELGSVWVSTVKTVACRDVTINI